MAKMNKEDLGLDRTAVKGRQRTINADGTYNMERVGNGFLEEFHLYRWLVSTSWLHYWLAAIVFYGSMNLLFAFVYFLIGVEQLSGEHGHDIVSEYLHCLFFSSQTFTTVGYGGIYPIGKMANIVAMLEAFIGLMTFSLATGTLYGRFSRATAKIKYSEHALIAPYKNITSLQFMIANQMDSSLVEVEVKLNIGWNERNENGEIWRRFAQLPLEIDKVSMLVTNWVINHPIDSDSILYGKDLQTIKNLEMEIFILLKAFDESFSQTIYHRHSFTASQFVYGAKFQRPFHIREDGKLILDLQKIGKYDKVQMP